MLYGKAPRFVRIKMNLTTIGIDWVNTIYEDFLFVTVRSIVSHLIILILLFVLVHSEQDLYFYALLTVMTNGIVYVSNLFYCKKYVKISNIVLNLFFIPKFKQNGAAITTVISEFIVFGYCFITFPKKSEFIDLKSWAKTFAQALIGSILILVLAAVLKQVFTGALVRLLVILPTAILVYGIGLLLCRNSYIYAGIDLIYRKWKV